MKIKNILIKAVLPVVIIIAGYAAMQVLTASRPSPEQTEKTTPGILVDILEARKENTTVTVKGTGTVEAAREISIIPQVSGTITYMSPDFEAGGFFEKGDVLFKIEDTDYRLALEQALSVRAKAEFDLATIESQARVARAEWEQINSGDGSPPNPLVVYEPQLKNARASLAAAKARVEQASLDLERTKIYAPFNARIRSKSVDFGQYVKSGSSVAVLAGTDSAEVAVPLSLDDLRWLNVPGMGERQNGASASVSLYIGDESREWKGRVIRSTGEIDPMNRMMKLIIGITDPYQLENTKDAPQPALVEGSFVDVHIKGRQVSDVFIIPRTALRDNSTVWIMDEEGKLLIRKIRPLRIEREKVIVSGGITDGEKIILTNISGAADGMNLRLSR